MIQGMLPQQEHTTRVSPTPSLRDAQTILLIDASGALPLLSPRPEKQSVILTQMRMLGATMLRTVNPDAIIAPLISSDWDIVDLGILLEEMGYCGTLFALTRPLPRAELVIREVSAVCPRLTVRLLETA